MLMREHLIEATNLVLGDIRFLTLPLPEAWDLAAGVAHPEVSASHLRHEMRWVAHGDFWYVVYHTELGWAMELHGKLRSPNRKSTSSPGEVIAVSGHPAWVTWRTRREGPPWRRKDVTYMTVSFDCLESDRRIELMYRGWCPEEGFRQVLKSLETLGCH